MLTAKIKNGKPVIRDELDRTFVIRNGQAYALEAIDIGDAGVKIELARSWEEEATVLITHEQAGQLASWLKGDKRRNRKIPEGATSLLWRMNVSKGKYVWQHGDKALLDKLRIALT